MKRNVLLLVDSFEVGGAETQMLFLARLLVTSGQYNVHFACLKRTGPLLDQAAQLGITDIPEFPLTSFYNWNALVQMRRFVRFLRQREISVVHTEGFYTNVFGLIGAALARVPARVGFRGSVGGWLTPRQERLERIAFRFASVVQANAEAVKSFLVSQGVPATRVVVVHYGLDLSAVAVPQNLSRADALRILKLPTDTQRQFVSIVANLHNPIKNYPMFLRAAARVREEVPTAAFLIAGEGALMGELRHLARELGLEKHVFFIGRCERVAELLFASDVCVLSSKGEGFSRSILEYMGAGRPVVATDVGGAREVIIEGETGHLVQSGDHETMAARIVSLLSDQAKAGAMGERGRQVVHEKFSAEAQLVQTERLYDELLAASRNGNTDVGAAMKTVDPIA
jgi:glycosyltransferase involved in cell wall biosynthesis